MKNSFIEFLDLENIDIAFEIVKLRCVQAEIWVFLFVSRHFEFMTSACIAQYCD